MWVVRLQFRFFFGLANGFVRDGVDIDLLGGNDIIGEQLECPPGVPVGGLATDQPNQVGFVPPIQGVFVMRSGYLRSTASMPSHM